MLDGAEVARHSSAKSCWLVISGQVYDFTSFLSEHPGGAPVLLSHGGTDATKEFKKTHSMSYLDDLPSGSHLGPLDPKTAGALNQPKPAAEARVQGADANKVSHVSLCVTLDDFQQEAKKVLERKPYLYIASSASTGQSLKTNLEDWSLVHYRPRILRNVEDVDMSTTILGQKSLYPFFVPPMGTMGLLHPGGEPEMVKALVRKGVHGILSTVSSRPLEEVMQTFVDEQKKLNGSSPSRLFFQFYVPLDRARARDLLRRAKKAGFKGLWITVDTPGLGKRTADTRLQAEEALAAGIAEVVVPTATTGNLFAPSSGGRSPPGMLSPNLTWEDIKWIRKLWDGPIVLKGIQNADDAKLALDYGCQGVLLSNHGGRQLHSAPSALTTLLEIRTYYPEILGKLEIYVDGGLRDGGDILKAICLGATAVGVGRPFLYALAAYGAAGVERCVDILVKDLDHAMTLSGISSLAEAKPELVNASRLLNTIWRPEQPPVRSRL
ncbi:L-lactate dehydrogenase [Thozetella sp. PMI_491]|nr:L-lactate dehydrogenase [Thozetella sp. PMI_491]